MVWKTLLPIRRLLVIAVLGVGLCSGVYAQDVPDPVPGGPEAVPDRQRETLKERHRDLISRFFTTANVSAAPTFNHDLAAYGFLAETGLKVTPHSAFSFAVGVREYVVPNGASSGHSAGANPPMPQKERIALFAVNYDLGLASFGETPRFARHAVLGVGFGGALGDAHLLTLEVTPKYEIPIDQYWSLPVGLKLGQAALGADRGRVRGTYVGINVGIKRFYGQRDRLK